MCSIGFEQSLKAIHTHAWLSKIQRLDYTLLCIVNHGARSTYFVKCFRYGGGYDLASRRKNATRESTATLKAWLSEHKKNPYPTKGEKIMLAIITKMTLTQVSKQLHL